MKGGNKAKCPKCGKPMRKQKGGGVYGFQPELSSAPNVMRHYPNISAETCEFDPMSVGVLRPSPVQAGGRSAGMGSSYYEFNPSVDVQMETAIPDAHGGVSTHNVPAVKQVVPCACENQGSTFDGYSSPLLGGAKKRKVKRGKTARKGKKVNKRKPKHGKTARKGKKVQKKTNKRKTLRKTMKKRK